MLYNLFEHTPYSLPERLGGRRTGRKWPIKAGIGLLIVILVAAFVWRLSCRKQDNTDKAEEARLTVQAAPARVYPLGRMGLPTPRKDLLDAPAETAFMPTASGRIESAFYGSTRRRSNGSPAFHEGLDIAPLSRDRRGQARDDIFAVAAGRIAYINPHAGNSNYGIYVVLFHDDILGEIYTLYAHLASVAENLRKGQTVDAGSVLGRMGRTPARIVPIARSHLHFEIGTIVNSRFEAWLEARKIPSPHGIAHGWNLLGADPLAVFKQQRSVGEKFTFLTFLQSVPTAFEWVVAASGKPDYFRRYPKLWQGDATFNGPALIIAFSEGGIPLRGRAASKLEAARLKQSEQAVVLAVDEPTLGGNGRRLIEQSRSGWRLSSEGRRWLDFFLYR